MKSAPGSSGNNVPVRDSPVTWEGLLYLFVVYIVWGSTYLAIRVAVREGAGFPPFTMGCTRMLLAGGLLLLWAAVSRKRLRVSGGELKILIASGVLLWVGGNGLVLWAEQRAASGYAALLVGSMPIWVSLMEAVLDRKLPSRRLSVSLLIGFAGLGLLTLPGLSSGAGAGAGAIIALLAAPVCWSAGLILQRRKQVKLTVTASSGYQQIFGGLGFALLALVFREPVPSPTAEALWAWGYLVVFGSILAFTSFIKALRLLPTSILMTYSYVNPVIAAVLGWLILRESINIWTVAGAALILTGIAGVFRDRQLQKEIHKVTPWEIPSDEKR
ncbi:MAG: EamA family transporter [Bacillota bacterium]